MGEGGGRSTGQLGEDRDPPARRASKHLFTQGTVLPAIVATTSGRLSASGLVELEPKSYFTPPFTGPAGSRPRSGSLASTNFPLTTIGFRSIGPPRGDSAPCRLFVVVNLERSDFRCGVIRMTTRSHTVPVLCLFLGLSVLPGMIGCNTMSGRMNNDIGQMYYRSGNYAMARGEFHRAAINDPYNADYAHNLAMAMRRQGDPSGAEQTLRKALDLDPGHQPSYHGLALIMKEQGRTAEAQELLSGWVAQQPYAHQAHVEMAWLQRETGDLTGAQASLKQALQIKPNDPIATAHLGQIYQDTNQPQLAQAMYRKSLATKFYQPELQARLSSMDHGHSHGGVQTAGGAMLHGPVMAQGPVMNGDSVMTGTMAAYPPAGPVATGYGTQAMSYSPGAMEMDVTPTAAASPALVPQSQPIAIGTSNPAIPGTLAEGAPLNLPASAGGLQPVAAGAPLGGDPAHAGDTTADLPVVSPY